MPLLGLRPGGLTGDLGLGDLEVLDLCLAESAAAGEGGSPAGGESPAAQVIGRAVGAVGDELVRSFGGSAAPCWYAAGQVDLGTPWSGLRGDGGVDRSGDERGHGPGCRFGPLVAGPRRTISAIAQAAASRQRPVVSQRAASFPCGGLQQSVHSSRALRRAAVQLAQQVRFGVTRSS